MLGEEQQEEQGVLRKKKQQQQQHSDAWGEMAEGAIVHA